MRRGKEKVKQEGRLGKELVSLGNSQLKMCFWGSFIECNLSTNEVTLPLCSSNGSERLKLPIGALKETDQRLFFQDWFEDRQGKNRYALLVLVRKSPEEEIPLARGDSKFWTRTLHELDLKKNPLLQLDFDSGTFRYYFNREYPLWLELIVVGSVKLTPGHEWAHVQRTLPSEPGNLSTTV